jgi:hypothetical protein
MEMTETGFLSALTGCRTMDYKRNEETREGLRITDINAIIKRPSKEMTRTFTKNVRKLNP